MHLVCLRVGTLFFLLYVTSFKTVFNIRKTDSNHKKPVNGSYFINYVKIVRVINAVKSNVSWI